MYPLERSPGRHFQVPFSVFLISKFSSAHGSIFEYMFILGNNLLIAMKGHQNEVSCPPWDIKNEISVHFRWPGQKLGLFRNSFPSSVFSFMPYTKNRNPDFLE